MKLLMAFGTALVVSTLLVGCSKDAPGESAAGLTSVEDILRNAMVSHHLPGMAAVVASSDGLLELQVVGDIASTGTVLKVDVLIPDADIGFSVVADAYSEGVESAVVDALWEIVNLYHGVTTADDRNQHLVANQTQWPVTLTRTDFGPIRPQSTSAATGRGEDEERAYDPIGEF